MEEIQIEKLIVEDFLKMGKFKELKSYKTYKETFKHYEKLEKSLTKEQQWTLFLFRDTYMHYHDLYLNEFADYLIKQLKQLYCNNKYT